MMRGFLRIRWKHLALDGMQVTSRQSLNARTAHKDSVSCCVAICRFSSQAPPRRGGRRWEASMRYFLCAVLLSCSLIAEGESSIAQAPNTGSGSFYVNGIIYQYVAATDYTVVAAAHSVINRKFAAVKVRV